MVRMPRIVNAFGSNPKRALFTFSCPIMVAALHCQEFLKQKNRYCAYPPIREFCTEHTINDENGCLLRTPCPFTKSHTVVINRFKKHLRTCANRPRNNEQAYYLENCNGTVVKDDVEIEQDAQKFSKIAEMIDSLISKIEHVQVETDIKSHEVLNERVEASSVGKPLYKKAVQHSSILGHLRDLGLISTQVNFIEFGSGSGETSKYVTLAVGKPKMTVLIDRKQIKLKLDQDFKRNPHLRVLIDIKDLNLAKVGELEGGKAVVYSKHLCGCATDLSIKCLESFRKQGGYK